MLTWMTKTYDRYGLLIMFGVTATLLLLMMWSVDMFKTQPYHEVSQAEATERCGGRIPTVVAHRERDGIAMMWACPGEYESFPTVE